MGRNLSIGSGERDRGHNRRGVWREPRKGLLSPEKEEGPEGFPFGPCFYQVD